MAEQASLNMEETQPLDSVEKYKFDPIKGYPMLHWHGKRPFTSTQYYPAQKKEVYGEPVNDWINKIFWGDNLQVMSHLLKEYRGKVDLIYIDPPFDSKVEYKKKIKLKGKTLESDVSTFEEKQYGDIWTNDEYLQFLYERLILIKELLTKSGVVVVHCDWHKSHYIRMILDEVFGGNKFINEIVWYYYNKMQGNIDRFASNHDVLIAYAKGENFTFNKVKEERDKPVMQIKRIWNPETKSLVNAKDEEGKVIYIESTHKTIDDVWRMSMLQPADKVEVTGYPTQKPEALLERLIYAYSNPGDLVFDGFMGAGTTCNVALKMGRKFIGSDINLAAIQTTAKRLVSTQKEERNSPKIKNGLSDIHYETFSNVSLFNSFEVYNVNNYDVFRNPVEAKSLLLEALEIEPTSGTIYDGVKDGYQVKVMPINRIATREDLNELIFNIPESLFEKRKAEAPNKPVESIMLICMGHEPDLKAHLIQESGYKLDVEVVDVLRDKANIQFKRDSEAQILVADGKLKVENFYPMNLLQKLSLQKETVSEWRELVESIVIDWNYDGSAMEPTVLDIPAKDEFVIGEYDIPADAGAIKIKITDLLSESYEEVIQYG